MPASFGLFPVDLLSRLLVDPTKHVCVKPANNVVRRFDVSAHLSKIGQVRRQRICTTRLDGDISMLEWFAVVRAFLEDRSIVKLVAVATGKSQLSDTISDSRLG